jgi:hypothetical protein
MIAAGFVYRSIPKDLLNTSPRLKEKYELALKLTTETKEPEVLFNEPQSLRHLKTEEKEEANEKSESKSIKKKDKVVSTKSNKAAMARLQKKL